ncbi:SixA phosphatase family protein [Hwangdonia lutea]|uniref:Phosphoglycerate mutase family protein n=1 Tax=Hwangdonia lutea TaxID=3075823 RepID=A0AA97ELF1_9FLAO|nr:phosphoglycerate mutase family protein [Hwangdonia sp. SCSIO 19198]WOD43131.1 phosphoglycerate mutase family protein [Hwangdonia sp. SCSIO 19198]
MKYFLLFTCTLLSTLTFSQEKTSIETSTYYFIRHAEKDRSDQTNKNPHLTEIGKKRAEHWSQILAHVKFDAIYSTDYNRTKETAQPTATKNGLELTLYHPYKLDKNSFLKDTQGKTVLVVGHSNTTPKFVNAILGFNKYEDINDSNNGNLYIVTVIDGKIAGQVLSIN